MVQISDENCRLFWSIRSGRVQKIPPPFPQLSKDEGLKDIDHITSIGNLILGVNSITVSYLIHYDSLLQNATDINTKCDSYFITKCDRCLFQNSSGFLLQNATVITKSVVYYKMVRYTHLLIYLNSLINFCKIDFP